MIISRDQTIAGQPATQVREVMRLLRERGYTVLGLAEETGRSEGETRGLVDDLVAEGLLERAERAMPVVTGTGETAARFDELIVFATTIAGNALAKARIGKRMARKEARELLQGVIDRAAAVNGSDDWLHWVREVVLYGSLASDGDEPVGDVDVAAVLEPRFDDAEYGTRQERMIVEDGARPGTITEVITFAHAKLLRHLRGRSPRVDLVDYGAGESLPPGAQSKLVYSLDTAPKQL
jgi:hypothetical protein